MAVVNLFFRAGQSNADEVVSGSTVAAMTALGIENPAYADAIRPGTSFREWYTSGGAQVLTTGVDSAPFTITGAVITSTYVTCTTDGDTPYGAKSWLYISGAAVTEYNGYKIISQDISATEFRFLYDNIPAFTGTATVRQAGWQEILANKVAEIEGEGDTVNIIGWAWMQGEGNAKSATIGEMDYFSDYLAYVKAYLLSTYSQTPAIVVGLPSYRPVYQYQVNTPSEAATIQQYMGTMRGKLIAGAVENNALIVETSDLDRGTTDPVHMNSTTYDTFNVRCIRAIQFNRNIYPSTRYS